MQVAESMPTTHGGDAVTAKHLVTALRQFAHNNPRFRRGEIDEIELEVMEGERLEDASSPQNHVQLTYGYTARRFRDPSEPRSRTVFEVYAQAKQDCITLPPHIAKDAYGIDDVEEAVKLAGPSILQRTLSFTISTGERTLNTCESYTYIDEDGDVVNSVCSCTEDSSKPIVLRIGEDADDESDEDCEDEGKVALLPKFVSPLSMPESINIESPEQAVALWAIDDIDPFTTETDETKNIVMVFSVFESMKKVLREQLGIE